jgi:O-antigen/teichoic acid export membrane protein
MATGKKILTDTLILAIASFSTKAITLLTMPLLARYYRVDQVGVIDLFTTLVFFLVTVLTVGQDSVFARYYQESLRSGSSSSLVKRALKYQFVAFGAFFVLFFVVVVGIRSGYLAEGDSFPGYLIIMSLPFLLLYTNAEVILRVTFSTARYLLLVVGFSIASLAAVVLAIKFYPGEPKRLLLFLSAVWVLFGALSIPALVSELKLNNKPDNREIIKYGVPMCLVAIVGLSQPIIDRMIILGRFDELWLGHYAVASKLCLILTIPASAFGLALLPRLVTISCKKEFNSVVNKVATWYLASSFILALAISLTGEEIISLIGGPELHGAATLLPALVTASYVQACSTLFGLGIVLSGRTIYRFYIQILTQMLSALIAVTLVKFMGVHAITTALVVSKICAVGIEMTVAQQIHKVDFNYATVVGIATTAIFVLGAVAYFGH